MSKLISYQTNMRVLSLLILMTLSGCEDKTATSQEIIAPPIIVEAISVKQESSYTVPREFVGLIQAKQQSNLGSEVSGKVQQILVNSGDKVQKGDPLLILDTELLTIEATQLVAQQQQIQAELDLVEQNLQRQVRLKQKGFAADIEIDNLNSNKKSLLANKQQLFAHLAANQFHQSKSTITAPYSGVISERFISIGDMVNTGSPTLTLLANQQTEAHIGIPIKYANHLRQQARWSIQIDNKMHIATLLNQGSNVDLSSRSVELRFSLPDQNHMPLNGELAYLQYQDTHHQNGYWLPLSALTEGYQGVWNVFVAAKNPTKSNYKIERRTVQVLYTNGKQAFISGAITESDRIIKNGVHRIVAGQDVQLKADSSHPHTNVDV